MVDAETSEDMFFRRLAEATAQLRKGFARSIGMSPQRVTVLVRLHRAGETSHRDLRQMLDVDGATITRLVKDLEREGLITRRVDPADNRYTLAALTPAGTRLAEDLQQRHQEYQERLLRGVSEHDQGLVVDALRRIRDNLADQEDS